MLPSHITPGHRPKGFHVLPQRHLLIRVYHSIHNSKETDPDWMSLNRWVETENVVHMYPLFPQLSHLVMIFKKLGSGTTGHLG